MFRLALVALCIFVSCSAQAEGTDWYCSYNIQDKLYSEHFRVDGKELAIITDMFGTKPEGDPPWIISVDSQIALIAHQDATSSMATTYTPGSPYIVLTGTVIIDKLSGTITQIIWSKRFNTGASTYSGTCQNGGP
jgi:hypothetical protein